MNAIAATRDAKIVPIVILIVAQLVIVQHMFSIFLTNAQLLVLLMDISIAILFVLSVIIFVKAAQPPLP